MYSLSLPVAALRTKMRQEFERHRYVKQLKTIDVLLFHSHAEFQVRHDRFACSSLSRLNGRYESWAAEDCAGSV